MTDTSPNPVPDPASVSVRVFRRSDRDQLTALVNAHIAAVVPGGSVSTQVLLSALEDEPGEYIINPWIESRTTLIAEQRGRLIAAAISRPRYRDDPVVSESLRNSGELRFVVFWPPSTLFPDTELAAHAVMTRAATQFAAWKVSHVAAGGTLPAPGIYGVPDQWPHVRKLYREHGFTTSDCGGIVMLARVSDIQQPVGPFVGARSVGMNGTRIDAVLDGVSLGYIEVDTMLDSGPRTSRFHTWADVGNVVIFEPDRRAELTRWLLGQAAHWLEWAGISHLLAYSDDSDSDEKELLCAAGFHPVTTVHRGYLLNLER